MGRRICKIMVYFGYGSFGWHLASGSYVIALLVLAVSVGIHYQAFTSEQEDRLREHRR